MCQSCQRGRTFVQRASQHRLGSHLSCWMRLLFRAYVASLRLAIALVCVGLSLIVSGTWLGLIPDRDALAQQARQENVMGSGTRRPS